LGELVLWVSWPDRKLHFPIEFRVLSTVSRTRSSEQPRNTLE